jgi:hypothetical protein
MLGSAKSVRKNREKELLEETTYEGRIVVMAQLGIGEMKVLVGKQRVEVRCFLHVPGWCGLPNRA